MGEKIHKFIVFNVMCTETSQENKVNTQKGNEHLNRAREDGYRPFRIELMVFRKLKEALRKMDG